VYDSPLRRELQSAGFPVRNGVIDLPKTPGIGFELPPEIVACFRLN
jgi:L-alanine-DL-glutamate epimerase-like enolase superfamily enzyme